MRAFFLSLVLIGNSVLGVAVQLGRRFPGGTGQAGVRSPVCGGCGKCLFLVIGASREG